MFIDILSLFPEYFNGPFEVSILKRAIQKQLIAINAHNIRDFSKDKHKSVDDRPFGGGPGMVMSCQPLCDAIKHVKKQNSKVIYLSPQGKTLNVDMCKRLSFEKHLILICGHYEGIDQRVIETQIDEEISIGDYILTNGCSAAIVLTEAVCRYIPGVLGHPDSAEKETFKENLFEGPLYTRPEEFEGLKVPEVLRSGNHMEIAEYSKSQAVMKMKKVRPDLYFKYMLDQKQKATKKVKNLVK